MEKLFKLSQNKTTVKTEIVAGLTTFMTMAYIITLIFLPILVQKVQNFGTLYLWLHVLHRQSECL